MRLYPLALILLAGCTHTIVKVPEPVVRTVEVKVPVDDPACVRAAMKRIGPAPAYPDAPEKLRAAANIFERVQLILAGRAMRAAREDALTAALEVCGG